MLLSRVLGILVLKADASGIGDVFEGMTGEGQVFGDITCCLSGFLYIF